ncbi:MAG: stage 0 sporulation family protein, partial [Gemmatimonadales bacterium]
MSDLVEVEFKGNRREFFLSPLTDAPRLKTAVIVEADRGEDLGHVYATGELALRRKAGTTHGKNAPGPPRALLRIATREDTVRASQLRADEDNVRRRAIEKVRSQGLEMKISDTEWQWDKKKLTIYFTAEQRVDFRQLVRQLEGLFGTRVQMWHIGVRDEARRLDGVGRCARQYCSASWLPELRPVKSSTAKDQRLSTLNPSQISGSCGRLMCCLRYEHEFYVQQRKRFPKEGKVLATAVGEEKVVSNDIFREQVTLRGPTGDLRVVPLAQLNRELGGEPAAAGSDLEGGEDESDFD